METNGFVRTLTRRSFWPSEHSWTSVSAGHRSYKASAPVATKMSSIAVSTTPVNARIQTSDALDGSAEESGGWGVGGEGGGWGGPKLQALVYDILPSTTAVFSCAIGSRKLSANEQFLFLVLKQ